MFSESCCFRVLKLNLHWMVLIDLEEAGGPGGPNTGVCLDQSEKSITITL